MALHAKPKVPLTCEHCGETFMVHPCYAKYGKRFCSKRCHNNSMATGKDKYRGRTARVGAEHVRIATAVLGHPLSASAEVHHVNGNGRDNAKTNLVICQDRSYHFLLHVRARVLRAGGDPNTQRICSSCHALVPLADYPPKSFGNSGALRRPCRQCIAMKADARRRAAGIPRKDTGRKYRYAGHQ